MSDIEVAATPVAQADGSPGIVLQIKSGRALINVQLTPEEAPKLAMLVGQAIAAVCAHIAGQPAPGGFVVPPGARSGLVIPQPIIRQNGNGGRSA